MERALAVKTKMCARLRLLGMGCGLWKHREGAPWRARVGELLRWGGALLAVSLLVLALTAPALLDLSHLGVHVRYLFGSHLGLEGLLPGKTLGYLLWSHASDFPLLVLAVIGVVLALRRRGRFDGFPLLWLTMNVVALSVMHPIWRQYYTMISIPVIWLAAQAIVELQRAVSASVTPLDGW